MKSGLDFSKFKKVASDKGCSTLRHADGHELRIAHKALSPQMRRDLDKLPLHAAEGADVTPAPPDQPAVGGDVSVSEVPGDFGAPEAAPPATPETPPPMPEGDQRTPQAPEGGSAAPAETEGEAPPPSPPAAPAAPPPVLATPEMAKQELKTHGEMLDRALQQGQIKPETYQSLFGKKDTLGKIGTLFGLLISGAGSGLTHQPNAVMEMMNKEIQNDLEAQKSSKTNAENLLRLNQEYTFKNADMRAKAIDAELTKGEIGMLPERKKFLIAQRKLVYVQAANMALAMSYQQENRFALHEIVTNLNRMPVGSPQRKAAEQQAAILSSMIKAEDGNIADRAALAGAAAQGLLGTPEEGGGGSEAGFQAQQRFRRITGHGEMANTAEAHRIPGISGESSIAVNEGDREKVRGVIDFDNQLNRTMIWAKAHAGTVMDRETVNRGKVMAADLTAAYRKATQGGVYKAGEQNFIEKIIPEDPSAFWNDTRVISKLQTVQKNLRSQADTHLKSLGFQGYKRTGAAPPKDGQTGVDEHGRRIVGERGKWILDKRKK